MEHKWQGISNRVFWCDNCGALKNLGGLQVAYCPVGGHWSFAEPKCQQEGIAQLREKSRERTAMIEELVWAMVQWSGDEEDAIHPDAYPAFRAACVLVGVPITDEATPEGDADYVYRFDLDWSERQREQWRRRMAAVEQ